MLGHTFQPSQDNNQSSPSWEYGAGCQDVGVGLNLFFAFSNGDSSNVCHSLRFPRAANISAVANANSLLLITPLEVFSFSCGYALNLVLWKLHF